MDEDKAVSLVLENWNALGVQTHNDVLHLPASIKRRAESGSVAEVPVMLRNITNHQRIQARVKSRAYALDQKLDLDRDKDILEDLENYAILTFAVRDAKAPFDQHVATLDQLIGLYDNQSLAELWGRYNVWVEMLDPRFGELDADTLWQTIARIAREGSASPLVAMRGLAQYTCIVLMAREALHSPNRPSWLTPPVTLQRVS